VIPALQFHRESYIWPARGLAMRTPTSDLLRNDLARSQGPFRFRNLDSKSILIYFGRRLPISFLILFLLGVKRPRPGRLVDFRPSVTVLIPAFNEERTIAATVESARLQTYPVEEIIVVDDGSKDRTREIAEKAGAKVISTPQNTGLKAKALNFGLKDVKTEIVVMIDADTVLAPDAIERILPGLSSDKVKVAGGVVLSTRMHSFWTKARSVQYLIAFGLVRKAQAHWNGILVCSGCFFAAKTKFLREIGGVPENTVGEDMALTWMAYLQGGEAEFIPAAKSYPVRETEEFNSLLGTPS